MFSTRCSLEKSTARIPMEYEMKEMCDIHKDPKTGKIQKYMKYMK
jgi:hypothetical protein